MEPKSLKAIWSILRDSMLLAVLRASLALIQLSADLLGLDRNAREAVVARLHAMLLPNTVHSS